MRILVIGNGGREHALAWALSRSPQKPELFVAPGNPGTASIARNVPIPVTDLQGLLAFVREQRIDLTVVGPEVPLVLGIVDLFEENGFAIVGPSAAAARLEGSKAFAKDFMDRYGIPTAAHRTFQAADYEAARAFVHEKGAPIVIKTSGLAAGKGAIVCGTLPEAYDALDAIMKAREFGDAGDEVVVEEFMEGEEASLFVLTDGEHYVLLPPAQDHKRIGEGDTGPNTGGMGAYAPAPVVTGRILAQACREIVEPTLAGMRVEGCPYRGFLYVGLMITAEGPKVVEYNCRMGDPETQAVLPLIDADWVRIFQDIASRRMGGYSLTGRAGAAVTVVMASSGYPGAYTKGKTISGIESADSLEGVTVFHAGTSTDESGQLVTSGGRVLSVTAVGDNLVEAVKRAYAAVDSISFEGATFRRDIAQKGLRRASGVSH